MNAALITTILTLLEQLAGLSIPAGTIKTVIDILTQIIPLAIEEAQDLAPIIKNVIAAYKAHGSVTDQQWADLDTLEQQVDADFDAATGAAEKDDAQT